MWNCKFIVCLFILLTVFATKTFANDSAKEASMVYMTSCSTCHGTTGNGKGPSAVVLNPKPRDFTDNKWQKSVTDKSIEKVILQGGPSIGKSQLMPPSPQFKNRKDLIIELRKIVRSFRKVS